MKITILVEGQTENAFSSALRRFLEARLSGRMPELDFLPCDGRIPIGDRLRRAVENAFREKKPAQAVIALTDVYTGPGRSDFEDADDAKKKMQEWVGRIENFYPHAAQYEFEAWLLPYWDRIEELTDRGSEKPRRRSKGNRCPWGKPESVNHNRPPSIRITEHFQKGACRDSYSKRRDAARILKGQDLTVAANICPELKAFLNTILTLCGAEPLA